LRENLTPENDIVTFFSRFDKPQLRFHVESLLDRDEEFPVCYNVRACTDSVFP